MKFIVLHYVPQTTDMCVHLSDRIIVKENCSILEMSKHLYVNGLIL